MSFGEGISEGATVEKLLLHLNGNSNDDSGNGHNGSDTNVAYSKGYGRFNEGARFQYVDSRISIADNLALRFTDNFTITFWMFTGNTDTANHSYIGKFRVVAGSYTGFVVNRYASKKIGFVIFKGGTSLDDLYTTSDSLVNAWYHLGFVKEGSSMKIYVNGKLDNSRSCGSMVYSTEPLLVGTGYGYSDANMDEVRIRLRALTAKDMLTEYTNALGRF